MARQAAPPVVLRRPVAGPGAAGIVYLVDDDTSMRQSIVRTLSPAGYEVHAFDSPTALLAVRMDRYPAVVVLDMRMPEMTGVQLQERLLERGEPVPIVFISGESTVAQAIAAMKKGAVEFLVKPFGTDALHVAVERALALDRENVRCLERKAASAVALAALAPREREVFDLVCQGYGNAEIVDRLGISLHTAKQYKMQILRKLDASGLPELMAIAAGRDREG